jgi:hypothetical protein
MQSNLKSVEMNENKLKAIAEDKSKTEDKRMLALIRLTNICGNKIKYYQLHFISDIVSNLNLQFKPFNISQLSIAYATRLQLIESIVIDREKHFHYIDWKYWYGLLLYYCFYPYSSQFNNDNCISQFDQSIRHRICQLIIETMLFVLSNNDEIDIFMKNNAYLHYRNVYRFTQLINAYRIKIDTIDLQLLKQRFDQAKIYCTNDYYMTGIVSSIPAIKQRKQ